MPVATAHVRSVLRGRRQNTAFRGERTLSLAKRLIFWLLIVAIVGAPVVAAELYLRSVGLGRPILFYANASYRYAMQPNQHQVRRRGASVSVDSKGLRSTKDWSDQAEAKILFVGDSVTWGGTYIDDRDTFSEGVCERLSRAASKTFVCGNSGANQYGTDNMAERIRYKDFSDESVLVITLIGQDTVRGLVDAEGRFLFTKPPPAPVRALWEATTFITWKLYQYLQSISYRHDDDFRVAERSLQNLFSAVHATDRPGRKVLIVLSPVKAELNGHEGALTKHVQKILAQSGFDVLDLHAAVSGAVTEDFYYDEVHLDVRGHHFYADQIAHTLSTLMDNSSAGAASDHS
jgi:hypothetical protein